MSEQAADWAILVYISADRVLTNFAVESLKQLQQSADQRIIVLAQAHESAARKARRYAFTEKRGPEDSLKRDCENPIVPDVSPGGIADPANLTNFLKWASGYEAKHRCLILWGHGYELLLNEDAKGSESGRNYLAPKSLKEALTKASQVKLDIIGIDACAMSLVEVACELCDCASFMVASQEDVPDTSFPYGRILQRLTERKLAPENVKAIAADIPKVYRQAYRDYEVGCGMGTDEITLTTLHLAKAGEVKGALTKLSTVLLSLGVDAPLNKTILEARQESRDFALGLFVDLYDFCRVLSGKLDQGESLKSACDAVCRAIDVHGEDAFIVQNQTGKAKSRCCGLSIYLPYLKEKHLAQAQQAYAEGASDLVGQLPYLAKGGTNHLLKGRGVKISEIEADYEFLPGFTETRWNEFIKSGWSVILAKEEKRPLDEHYSAQQCAMNLLPLCRTTPALLATAAGKG